jgi:membrane-associated phospholipid phosphatase
VIVLPSLLRRPKNPLLYAFWWAPYIALYQLVNRYPVFEPRELPYSALDQAIPFLPSLLPLYVAYIPFYWWTVARSEDDATLNRIFYAAHFQLLLCVVVYVFFPVRMPRELFYPPDPLGWADLFWRWFDGPNNCLPSLHTANCLLFIRFNWNRSHRALSTAFAAAIIASTVLVKQHYAVDVVAGGLVYALTAVVLSGMAIRAAAESTPWREDRAGVTGGLPSDSP